MLKHLWFKLLLGFSGLVILAIVGLGLFLSKGIVLSERHQPYTAFDNFDFADNSFEEYIQFSQAYLRAARTDSPAEELIQNASPFIFEPGAECEVQANGKYNKGIVLNHGLIASPYSVVDIAKHFQSRCFYVLGILLPDHVSRPGDFLKTHWEDWAQVQEFAISQLEEKVESIFLSGHSTGATLAVYGAATNTQIEGLILFTPAFRITAAAKYAGYISWLGSIFPKAAWFEIREDEAAYRYESITYSAAEETYALIQVTKKELLNRPLTVPIYSVASVEDNTVDTDAILQFMQQQTHPLNKTLLFSQHTLEELPANLNVEVLNSYAPEQGILSVSHLGIMTPASHLEYGVDGNYRNCGHYEGRNYDSWERCKSGQRDYYGEVTAENLQQGLIERIAFNPFYTDLLEQLDDFLESL